MGHKNDIILNKDFFRIPNSANFNYNYMNYQCYPQYYNAYFKKREMNNNTTNTEKSSIQSNVFSSFEPTTTNRDDKEYVKKLREDKEQKQSGKVYKVFKKVESSDVIRISSDPVLPFLL